eukprot:gb/GFBE01005572.1/.p1 GENE.gb/GFBE01005572.1/~~gb/GFBE01005572.1/.p1  ORF type:complete len:512 (+),score=52.42 gb/GFBE01005572.1/:1-1536(+)
MSGMFPVGGASNGSFHASSSFQASGSFRRCTSQEAVVIRSVRHPPGGLAAAATAAMGHGLPPQPPNPGSPTAQPVDGSRVPLPRAFSTFAGRHQLTRQASNYDEHTAKRKAEEYVRIRGVSPDLSAGGTRRYASPRVVPVSPDGSGLQRAWSAVSWTSQSSQVSGQPQQAGSSPRQPRQQSRPGAGPQAAVPQAVVLTKNQSFARSNSIGPRSVHDPIGPPPARSVRGYASPRGVPTPMQKPVARPAGGAMSFSPPPVAAASGLSALVGCAGPDRRTHGGPPPQGYVSDRPPLSGLRPSRSRATGEHPLDANRYAFNDLEEQPEFSEPSSDLNGLVRYLDGILKDGLRITQAVYCVNAWKLYGFIPLKHHGFILYTEGPGSDGYSTPTGVTKDFYLTLDFSTRGILWDTFDTFPDVPDGTLFTKTYQIDLDPAALRDYCKDTKPFAWPENDCKKWARGVLQLMGIQEEPFKDEGAIDRLTRGDVRVRDVITCGGSGNVGSMGVGARLIGCM